MRPRNGFIMTLLALALSVSEGRGAQPFPQSALDRLDRSAIPAEELELYGAGKPPDELVAIIGSGKFSHWGDIAEVLVSRDGKSVVTVGDDRALRVWDLQTGRQLWRLDDPKKEIRAMALSSDGERLATCVWPLRDRFYLDSVVDLWEFPDGKPIRSLTVKAYHYAVAFSRDGTLVAAANQNDVFIWDVATGQPKHAPPETRAPFGDEKWDPTPRLAFSPDGALIVGCLHRFNFEESQQDAIRVWETQTGKSLRMVAARVGNAPFLPDGTLVAVGFEGGLFLLNPREGQIVREVVPPLAKDKRPFGYRGPGPPFLLRVGKTALVQVGTVFDKQVTARLINLESGDEQEKLEWPERPVKPRTALDVRPDEKQLVLGNRPALRFWNLESGNEDHPAELPLNVPNRIAFARDESWLAIGGQSGDVVIWDISKGEVGQRLVTECKEIKALAVSPDGKWLVSGGDGDWGWFRVWETATWNEVARLGTMSSEVSFLHFLDGGRRLLGGCWTGDAAVWDVAGWKSSSTTPWKLNTKVHGLGKLAVASSGHEIAATLEPKMLFNDDSWMKAKRNLTLWHFPGGKARQIEIKNPVRGLAISPDGKLVAAALTQGFFDTTFDPFTPQTAIAVWEPDKKREPRLLQGHGAEVWGVAFSPDGQRLASVSRDGTIGLWDVATGKRNHSIAFASAHAVGLMDGAFFGFSPSGRHFAVCNANGTVYVFRLPPA